jgi:hypothetical protein
MDRTETQQLIRHYLPKGLIMMWYGSIASIPQGWALCNGDNSTPDLRDKFVVGATSDDSGTAKTNVTTALTQSGGDYRHRHGGATGAGDTGVHRDTAGAGDNAQGLNHTHSIAYETALPPYYALAYIMKL